MNDFTSDLIHYKQYEDDDINHDAINKVRYNWVYHILDETFRFFVILLITFFSFIAGQVSIKIEAIDAGVAKIAVDDKGNEKFQFLRAR